MVISGRTKHYYHQASIYPVIADKTPLRVNLATVFASYQPLLNIARAARSGSPHSRILVSFLMGLQVNSITHTIHIIVCIIKLLASHTGYAVRTLNRPPCGTRKPMKKKRLKRQQRPNGKHLKNSLLMPGRTAIKPGKCRRYIMKICEVLAMPSILFPSLTVALTMRKRLHRDLKHEQKRLNS